ncbi:MAG TPA: hypothetical protein PLK34_01295 [Candidatus Pacearchaeota archaeon]|nr:hypothetical protein [Candidatus Pacearchaeota archaeon]
MNEKSVGYDSFGNAVVLKFSSDWAEKAKKKFADELLRKNKAIKTVLEKTGKFKGRLRKMQTKHLAGEKTKDVVYHENGCVFRFNVDDTYFSSRLSNERAEIAKQIKKQDNVLVMFAGVAPYPIVIARNSNANRVYSNEINRTANKYAELNIELNKLKDKVILLPGDIKLVSQKIKKGLAVKGEKVPKEFDVIVMPRPQLKDSFLEQAFALSRGGKKGTRVYYYDFYKESELNDLIEKIKIQAMKAKKKIKILNVKKAGEVAPYTFRFRVDFRVL